MFMNLIWCFQVTCSVLQLVNEIIKDNTDFQENASLVGLVSLTFHLLANLVNLGRVDQFIYYIT